MPHETLRAQSPFVVQCVPSFDGFLTFCLYLCLFPLFFLFAAAPGMGLQSSLCLALKMRLLNCFAPQVLVPFVPAWHSRMALLLEPFLGVHLHQTYQLFWIAKLQPVNTSQHVVNRSLSHSRWNFNPSFIKELRVVILELYIPHLAEVRYGFHFRYWF